MIKTHSAPEPDNTNVKRMEMYPLQKEFYAINVDSCISLVLVSNMLYIVTCI
jgi:hypothetical protein